MYFSSDVASSGLTAAIRRSRRPANVRGRRSALFLVQEPARRLQFRQELAQLAANRGVGRLIFRLGALLVVILVGAARGGIAQHSLRPLDRVPFGVQQRLDAAQQVHVLGPVIAASATTLDGRQDRELGLPRSDEHTSELQSLMRLSYAVFCLKKNNK